ncbi:uncharacterized protein LOC129189460 isoform X2 [Dunckerocampus dactyliophorus]|uniref:uncharacterized protein LOC129189460 isoform X2 n=1 Tax=Dunckerocampus dactyliophorus TaxID=161453 RepID=UPI00240719CE|nr:uncharacterized protein LOC129189460 isoform X2 [Dunckerocampus dactyliophorus]
MWRYQKPGFEALLVAELQRQQQHRQFCDTLLRAEGKKSCLKKTNGSAPLSLLPAGVSVPAHSCVLSAISPQLSTVLSSSSAPPAGQEQLVEFGTMGATALLNVVKLLYSGEMAGEGEREKQQALSAAAKMGILDLVEVTQRRHGQCTEVGVQTDTVELREGKVSCVRWRREVRDGSTVLWKETNAEKDVQTEGPQVSANPSCPAVPTYETIDIAQLQSLGQTDVVHPFVPISLIHLQENSQNSQTYTVAGHTPGAEPPYLPAYPSQWTADSQGVFFPGGTQAAGRDILEGGVVGEEQFEQYRDNIPGFISHFLNLDHDETGQARRKQRGARRAAERKPRRPRRLRGGRVCGGWMQTVDVQDVDVSKQHKSLLQRCGMAAALRTGQGGGAAGRKLYPKTRHILGSPRMSQGRRGRGTGWDFSLGGESHYKEMGGGGNVMHGKKTKPECKKVSPAASSTPAALSHPAPLPHEDPPENLDCLLEEVMRGLDVMSGSSAPDSQPCQERRPAATTEVAGTGRGGTSDANDEVGLLEPQEEGDLTTMLEDFLQSLEPHGDSCVVRGEERNGPQQRKGKKTTPSKTQSAPPHKAVEGVKAAGNRKRKKQHPQNEKKQIPYPVSDTINKIVVEGGDVCLRRRPVVKLERHIALTVNASSQTISCQALKEAPDTPAESTSIYPIRNRCKKAQNTRLVEKTLPPESPQAVRKRGRSRKNTQPLSPITPISGTPAGPGNLTEKNQEGGSKAAEKKDRNGAVRRSLKRCAEPEEETSDIGSETKKKRLEKNAPPPFETVLQASREETGVVEQNKELANMGQHLEGGKAALCVPPSPKGRPGIPGSEEEEEDVDVIGTCDSIPDPVIITWSPSSDSEGMEGDEEIDVIGVSDFASSAALALNNVVDRTYHAEVPLR